VERTTRAKRSCYKDTRSLPQPLPGATPVVARRAGTGSSVAAPQADQESGRRLAKRDATRAATIPITGIARTIVMSTKLSGIAPTFCLSSCPIAVITAPGGPAWQAPGRFRRCRANGRNYAGSRECGKETEDSDIEVSGFDTPSGVAEREAEDRIHEVITRNQRCYSML